MTDERRIQERFSLDLQAKVTYKFTDNDPQDHIEAVAANISSGGAFLNITDPLPLACKVRVEFMVTLEELKKIRVILAVDTLRNLANNQHVWVDTSGVVIRQEQSGVAIIFDDNYQITPLRPAS